MPKYEFLCEDCGPFEERRALADVEIPMICPSCGEEAKRVYSMPNLKTVSPALSNAMNRVDKSAHEPKVVRQPEGGTWPGKRYHPGHGGHHGHNH